MNKLLIKSFLMCMLTTLLFALPMMASAENSGTCGDNLTWTLDDEGTLVISGTGEMNNYTNDNLAPWRTDVKSAVIEDGVTSIGDCAFSKSSSLTSISIPESVTRICDAAFYRCSSLTSITIPGSVASISEYAFSECPSLASITILNGVTSIGHAAFSSCSSLTSITIPDSVISISSETFRDCCSLMSIRFPKSVTSFGSMVFSGCSSLTSTTIPEGATKIGRYSFEGCSNLTSIEIPESVTSIEDYAFDGCSMLTSITLPEGIASITSNAFKNCPAVLYTYYNSTTAKTLTAAGYSFIAVAGTCGDNLTWTLDDEGTLVISGTGEMEDFSYSGDVYAPWIRRVKNVIIEEGATSIGDSAFAGCSSLTSISIPESITSIGAEAFTGCRNLTSISIPEGVTTIGTYAFSYSGMTSFNIPESVTSIGSSAFEACSRLTSINIPASITNICGNCFYECTSLTTVTFSEGLTSIGSGSFASCSSLSNISLPATVTNIDGYAFAYCSKLINLTIPDSVTSIGDEAFYGSGLSRIVIQSNDMPELGTSVFPSNRDLTIYCYEYSDADLWAFANGYSVVYLDGKDLSNPLTIVLPNDLELWAGAEVFLAAELFPDVESACLTWTTSDAAVATVEGGLLTAVGNGTATITASCGDVSDEMMVTVRVGADSFDLNETDLWMVSKETFQLSIVNLLPEDANVSFTWESSDTAVIKVDDAGLVTSLWPGEATVTVTSTNGVSRSYTVHVCYPVTAVEFELTELALLIGETAELKALVTARDTTVTNQLVTFSSSDETIATVAKDGAVTIVGTGMVEITATAASGVSASCTITASCEHQWNRGVYTIKPTCTEPGEKLHTCFICGDVKTEATGLHLWSSAVITTVPSDEAAGVITYTCLYCDETFAESFTYGLPGDVNEDRTVDMLDVINMMEWFCNGAVDLNLGNADVTADGSPDMVDIITLLKWYCGDDVTLSNYTGSASIKMSE